MLVEPSAEDLRLVVVSNRGPVEHHLRPDNQIEARRASGGLVTALSAFRKRTRFSWIACAVTSGDRQVARGPNQRNNGLAVVQGLSGGREDIVDDSLFRSVDLVATPEQVFRKHYEVFSNRTLWFLQHSMWDQLQPPKDKNTISDAWWNGYVPTNVALARAAVAKARKRKSRVIMLHDYHLYLAPGYIRQHLPDVILQHFVHIPWPELEVWEPLPLPMLREICRNLLSNDIIGFQTPSDAHNFLRCCDVVLEDVQVDYARSVARFRGRDTRVRVYPISIDVAELRRTMNLPTVKRYQERLRRLCGDRTIVRVDRLDPSKNIARGFLAFEQLLSKHPEFQGKTKLLAFLVPSRTQVKEYVQCYNEITSLVNAINLKFASGSYKPIEVFYENNYYQALAGMSLCDVLLVNPIADGMNLVAKEGPIVSARDSVLVLSKAAGAFGQLGCAALGIEPRDIHGTANALANALAMPQEERCHRARTLRANIEKEDIFGWVASQTDDIDRILA